MNPYFHKWLVNWVMWSLAIVCHLECTTVSLQFFPLSAIFLSIIFIRFWLTCLTDILKIAVYNGLRCAYVLWQFQLLHQHWSWANSLHMSLIIEAHSGHIAQMLGSISKFRKLAVGGTRTQVLADNMGIAANVLNHCGTYTYQYISWICWWCCFISSSAT